MNSMVEEQQQQKMRCLKNFSDKLQFRHTSCRQLQYHSIEREFSNNWHKITMYDLSISSHCTRRDATLRRYIQPLELVSIANFTPTSEFSTTDIKGELGVYPQQTS